MNLCVWGRLVIPPYLLLIPLLTGEMQYCFSSVIKFSWCRLLAFCFYRLLSFLSLLQQWPQSLCHQCFHIQSMSQCGSYLQSDLCNTRSMIHIPIILLQKKLLETRRALNLSMHGTLYACSSSKCDFCNTQGGKRVWLQQENGIPVSVFCHSLTPSIPQHCSWRCIVFGNPKKIESLPPLNPNL